MNEWDGLQEANKFGRQLTWSLAVERRLTPYEDPDEFVCRMDPDTLVSSVLCADCPLVTRCFDITEGDLRDAERRLESEEEY